LQLLEPDPDVGVTFFGNGGFSADGLGEEGITGNTVQAEVPAGSNVVQAYLYGSKFIDCSSTLDINFDGTVVTLSRLLNNEHSFLCSYRADVTSLVAAKVGSGGGITNFAINNDPFGLDGVALIVVFENPSLPEISIAILDGGLASTPQVTTLGLAVPLDKNISGFSAIMSLGIGFSFQGPFAPSHECGTFSSQSSLVDINGDRLTSCAGNFDDGLIAANGALITVGGVGDGIDNPSDPFQQPADGNLPRVIDDELYNIAPFLDNGDTAIVINTQNPSGDDMIFLTIIAITAQASVGEICGDGIDNDEDGKIDEGCTVKNTGTLIVFKQVINNNDGEAGPDDFEMTVTGNSPSPDSFPGDIQGTIVTLNEGEYSVSESEQEGYIASFSEDCSDTISAGETKFCTVSNKDIGDEFATLVVIKHVINDDGGTAQASDFRIDLLASGEDPDQADGEADPGIIFRIFGGNGEDGFDPNYTVEESGPEGYTARFSADCQGAIQPDEIKTCTITNDDTPTRRNHGGLSFDVTSPTINKINYYTVEDGIQTEGVGGILVNFYNNDLPTQIMNTGEEQRLQISVSDNNGNAAITRVVINMYFDSAETKKGDTFFMYSEKDGLTVSDPLGLFKDVNVHRTFTETEMILIFSFTPQIPTSLISFGINAEDQYGNFQTNNMPNTAKIVGEPHPNTNNLIIPGSAEIVIPYYKMPFYEIPDADSQGNLIYNNSFGDMEQKQVHPYFDPIIYPDDVGRAERHDDRFYDNVLAEEEKAKGVASAIMIHPIYSDEQKIFKTDKVFKYPSTVGKADRSIVDVMKDLMQKENVKAMHIAKKVSQ